MTPFDPAFLDRLRKDFLVMMKNSKLVKTPQQALEWKGIMATWKTRFHTLVYEQIKRTIGDLPLKTPSVSRADAQAWQQRVSTGCWDLYINASVPMERPTDFWDLESRWVQFQKELPKWEGRLRRGARKAWETLSEFVGWYRYVTLGEDPAIEIPKLEQTTIEGFKVQVKGYTGSPSQEEWIADFKEGLKHYKQRAQAVLPLLVKTQLPLVLDFTMSIDLGGEYHRTHIDINPSTSQRNPGRMAKTLAHEMGHHIYQTYLSQGAESFWEKAISGNYGEINLHDVLRKIETVGGDFYDNDALRQKDPIMYLQVQGLFQNHPEIFLGSDYVFSANDLREYLANGGRAKFHVHAKPISGYAHKNPEEAFCEALGLLVAYGPQAVLTEVRGWLKVVLPNIRVASNQGASKMAQRVAAQWLALR